jgi:hypothetical protein
MFPIALGSGDRLFAEEQALFDLKESEVYANGVVHLCLVPR